MKKLEAINTVGMKKAGTFKFVFPCNVADDDELWNWINTEGWDKKGVLFYDENGNMKPVFLLSMRYDWDDWFETSFGIVIPEEDVYEISLNEEGTV